MEIKIIREGTRQFDRDVWTIQVPLTLVEASKAIVAILQRAADPIIIMQPPAPPKEGR